MLKKIIYIVTIAFIANCFASEETNEKPAPEKPNKKSKKKKEKKESYLDKIQRRYIPRMPYLILPTITVPIIKRHELKGYLTLLIELKGKDLESYRKLVKDTVLIKEKIFIDLVDAMNRLWVTPELPSTEIISGRIKNCIKDHFKEDLTKKVILHVLNFNDSIFVN